jgi:hypothetical protein
MDNVQNCPRSGLPSAEVHYHEEVSRNGGMAPCIPNLELSFQCDALAALYPMRVTWDAGYVCASVLGIELRQFST